MHKSIAMERKHHARIKNFNKRRQRDRTETETERDSRQNTT